MHRSFIVFLMSSAILLAQLNRATITGNIPDPGGAAIPNAKVFARNSGTNSAVETTTNAEGQFSFPNLPIGNYDISAEAASFKRAERKQIELNVREVLRVDLQLQLGSVAETIEVSGELPRLQTDSPEVGTRLSPSPSEPGRRFTLCRSPKIGFESSSLLIPTARSWKPILLSAKPTVRIFPRSAYRRQSRAVTVWATGSALHLAAFQ